MAIPNKATANANTTAELADLKTAATDQFKADAEAAINSVINDNATPEERKYRVTLMTSEYCDLPALVTYFTGLGYKVWFPELVSDQAQPAQLFGDFWEQYWSSNNLVPRSAENPVKMTISWK